MSSLAVRSSQHKSILKGFLRKFSNSHVGNKTMTYSMNTTISKLNQLIKYCCTSGFVMDAKIITIFLCCAWCHAYEERLEHARRGEGGKRDARLGAAGHLQPGLDIGQLARDVPARTPPHQ